MNGTTYINSNTVDEIAVSSNGKYVYWLSESDGISRATDYGDTITHWHSKPNANYVDHPLKNSNYFTIGKRHQEYDTSNNLENEYYVFYNSHFSHVPGGSNNRNYSTITMSSSDYTSNYIHYLVSVRSVINTDKWGFQVMELEGYN